MNTLKRIVSSLLILSMLLPLALSFVSCGQADDERENNGILSSDMDNFGIEEASQTVTVGGKTLTLSEIDALRASAQAADIEAIKGYIGGDEGAEALKDFYSLFGAELYIWLANLYDPEVGGFYYSNSARDNYGFLPDLESTRQALTMLEDSGMTDAWTNIIPEDIKTDIGTFVTGLKGDDGYYYHPQWGMSIPSTRRSRDLTSAKNILNALGLSTAWAEESGSKVSAASVKLTGRLSSSRVVAVAATPSHLASEDAFRAYLDGLADNMAKNSYSTGNLLNAQVGEINAAGLHDVLIEYLDAWKNDGNGLWEDTVTYQSINGLMKISAMYYSYEFSDPYTSLVTLIDFLAAELDENGDLTDEAMSSITGITSVYNPWVIMEKLYCKNAVFADGEKEVIGERLSELAPKLIRATTEKFKTFKRDDGGFSYTATSSATTMLGVIAAVANTKESDVNSTGMPLASLRKYMLEVFGVPAASIPDIYSEYDKAYFVELISEREPVKKIVNIMKPSTSTYDDYEEADGDTDGGVLLYPNTSVTTNIGDTDRDSEFNYVWFRSSIVSNPGDSADKVLYAETFVYDRDGDGIYEDGLTGEEKEMAPSGKSSSTDFSMLNASVDGDTYVFETDIYVSTESTGVIAELFFNCKNTESASTKLQLKVVETSSLGGLVKTKSMQLLEAQYSYGSNGSDGTVVKDIKLDTWNNIRFELTKTYTDSTLSEMTMKIYVNDTLQKEFITGRYSSGAYIDNIVDSFRISYYRTVNTRFYLDDTYAAKVASAASVDDYYPGSTTDDVACNKEYTVTVKNSDGEGISDVALTATSPDGETRTLTTNSSGIATFSALPADWCVSVISTPSAYLVGEGTYSFDSNRTVNITLENATYVLANITAATLVHSDKISIAFRIDSILSADAVSGVKNLNVLYRWFDEDSWKSATLRTSDTNTDKAVFVTEGVAAYELTRRLAVVAYVGDELPSPEWLETSAIGKEYSVAEFLYNKLYRDGYAYSDDTSEQSAADCYLKLIEYGRTAQLHLGQNTDSLVSDCTVVYTTDSNTTLDGTNTYLFAYPGESLTLSPTYSGSSSLSSWTIEYSDGTSESLASTGSKTVSGIVCISPKTN